MEGRIRLFVFMAVVYDPCSNGSLLRPKKGITKCKGIINNYYVLDYCKSIMNIRESLIIIMFWIIVKGMINNYYVMGFINNYVMGINNYYVLDCCKGNN